MKVVTDEQKIDNLIERGVENVFVKEDLKKKLLSGKRLRVYLGIDPTGPTLHMGHAIPLKKLKEFQELGHEVILLMGDFTAMIGDPTDKLASRKQLTHKEVLDNLKKYKKQASVFLKFGSFGGAQFKFNSKWLAKMNFGDVLDLASRMTVDQMLKRDMFVVRAKEEKPIFIHEFLYPLMQGYDSVAMEVDVEVGGNDQTFNMLAGRHLASQMIHKDKIVLATKLLEDNTGKKMGKTEGNMITFEDSPNEMFGKVMSWNDFLIYKGFELCTDVPMSEVKEFQNKITAGANPKDFKVRLAKEIVAIFHNTEKANSAEQNFTNTFQKGEIPEEMEEVSSTGGKLLSEMLVQAKVISSKSEFRRLVEENAVTNLSTEEKINDINFIPKVGDKFKIGKRRFVKIC
ncbi:MAG: tyrosine--tRNA ligase [Candidatus Paceibacterota bacterium]|jgi:tyrosyl-tRNA synthetase